MLAGKGRWRWMSTARFCGKFMLAAEGCSKWMLAAKGHGKCMLVARGHSKCMSAAKGCSKWVSAEQATWFAGVPLACGLCEAHDDAQDEQHTLKYTIHSFASFGKSMHLCY
eukprot:scaffold81716_cov19-Tisochrysis_lutea.AAC.1